ncbi:MAG TPA: c-type cytochrome biogenesis protein CcsB [Smithellaceae bacterium]|jgi:cytochrome c-type biogenesis protein CcsB|nr:c-type cytochrome biogenesis protein CcsB [Smithellaceae bacterium]HNT91287.1 c-type cytochrome biogenesis protein CcsB [Smithellaceae bacterium]HNV64886.1 c-type cytochrome biogenesis protein CcsB [Smithellaceae bacterium]HOD30921.1 c-type cytochrome biogenesis protein CcsB [Smithellaceae bacterium]HOF76737.1 c-type cytochrome biogenesis protein CcsB [Smithellaceae bacterium]
MTDTVILNYVTFIYFTSFVLYLFRMIFLKEFWARLASFLAWTGFFAHTFALILRWKASYNFGFGHAPLSNLYESLVFFAWSIIILYLTVEWRIKDKSLGAFVVPITFFTMAYASIAPGINNRIEPLIPALQSNWLTTHVVTCFMGYAAFTVAFGCGLLYLWKSGKEAKYSPMFAEKLPPLPALDLLIYQSAALGFVFLAIGIITGSVWAHYAWGAYWSWDPKETWSLITWLVYAIMIHARYVRGWHGKRLAVLAVIGFVCMLFTYLGVNLLSSLHSYL